jgi:hypothetical protein
VIKIGVGVTVGVSDGNGVCETDTVAEVIEGIVVKVDFRATPVEHAPIPPTRISVRAIVTFRLFQKILIIRNLAIPIAVHSQGAGSPFEACVPSPPGF